MVESLEGPRSLGSRKWRGVIDDPLEGLDKLIEADDYTIHVQQKGSGRLEHGQDNKKHGVPEK